MRGASYLTESSQPNMSSQATKRKSLSVRTSLSTARNRGKMASVDLDQRARLPSDREVKLPDVPLAFPTIDDMTRLLKLPFNQLADQAISWSVHSSPEDGSLQDEIVRCRVAYRACDWFSSKRARIRKGYTSEANPTSRESVVYRYIDRTLQYYALRVAQYEADLGLNHLVRPYLEIKRMTEPVDKFEREIGIRWLYQFHLFGNPWAQQGDQDLYAGLC